jgi:squalene-hopene/tetraprenyl-beta-curcumene cyclase
MTIDRQRFEKTRRNAIEALLSRRNEHGWWEGELSSSALSTATAVVALSMVGEARRTEEHAIIIHNGLRWLRQHQNTDGGWGDTVKSFSNISTTMLCWAALNIPAARANPETVDTARFAEKWLADHAGSLYIPDLVEAVMARYGKDRTFSVPILTMCALCGRLGDYRPGGEAWKYVKQLPFELAAFPQNLYNKLNLRVVSYALPALIAIGQARHHHRPTLNPITRLARRGAKQKTLDVLQKIQPGNGGFLEAAPLTSFVTMSLASIGLAEHAVARKGVGFLVRGVREDGSWPIDTNLATWVTTLSVNALAAGGKLDEYLNETDRAKVRDWIVGQQYTEVHPYTGAEPGGWAWTDLPGGVPDADDTSGAVIALCNLSITKTALQDALRNQHDDKKNALAGILNSPPEEEEKLKESVRLGLEWLENLQNADGGIPTFCRGWGKLPFDRSSCDITAHFIRSCHAATVLLPDKIIMPTADLGTMQGGGAPPPPDKLNSQQNAYKYLLNQKGSNGAWTPLWFGNQHLKQEENPTYATSLVAMTTSNIFNCRWLLKTQNTDGGWGGGANTPSSIEETALVISAIAQALQTHSESAAFITKGTEAAKHFAQTKDYIKETQAAEAVRRGVNWLIDHTKEGTEFESSPIGFYFAKLWYFEAMYPLVWTVGAMERVGKFLEEQDASE